MRILRPDRSAERSRSSLARLAPAVAFVAALVAAAPAARAQVDLAETIADVQPKIVKIYGAGGFTGLEPYQSGALISSEGHILTAWSHVLDTDYITVTLDDGRKYEAKLLGADPRLELAVLKIDATGLPAFDLAAAVPAAAGTRVLAFSNLFGVATGSEPASVQHGSVAAVWNLDARHGTFETPYRGPVYVLDAVTNNPGAAGGALTDNRGQLLGMLGKEMRNAADNTWLNYATPVSELQKTVDEIVAGRFVPRSGDDAVERAKFPHNLEALGIILVPDVVERTPPFIDVVLPGSVAAKAGLEPDDLIVFVDGRLVQSCKLLGAEVELIDRADPLRLTVQRGQQLIDIALDAPEEGSEP